MRDRDGLWNDDSDDLWADDSRTDPWADPWGVQWGDGPGAGETPYAGVAVSVGLDPAGFWWIHGPSHAMSAVLFALLAHRGEPWPGFTMPVSLLACGCWADETLRGWDRSTCHRCGGLGTFCYVGSLPVPDAHLGPVLTALDRNGISVSAHMDPGESGDQEPDPAHLRLDVRVVETPNWVLLDAADPDLLTRTLDDLGIPSWRQGRYVKTWSWMTPALIGALMTLECAVTHTTSGFDLEP